MNAKDFILERNKRFIGKKYIADIWMGLNTTDKTIYIDEEEFYTKGILAVAIEKNKIVANESFYLILILNKSSIQMLEEN